MQEGEAAGMKPEMRQCAFCKKTGEKMKKCSQCRVTYYCSVQCQASDKIRHESYVCASYQQHARINRLFTNSATDECYMPVHETDIGGVLHAQYATSLLTYKTALEMPAENKLEIKTRVKACNAIVDGIMRTAKAWRCARDNVACTQGDTATAQRLMHELLKKRVIEIMLAYVVCTAFGQCKRASDFKLEVHRHVARLATEEFEDDFDFDVHLTMFNKNTRTSDTMQKFEVAMISFAQIRHCALRFRPNPVEWNSFLWHNIDKTRLLLCYHQQKLAYAAWQAHENHLPHDEKGEMPADVTMYSCYVCLVLGRVGDALVYLRRTSSSNLTKNNAEYTASLDSLWRDYKKISKCICSHNQCVGCVRLKCVKYTRAISMRTPDGQIGAKGPPNVSRKGFLVELRQAGVIHSLCPRTCESMLTASCNGVKVAVWWQRRSV